MKSGIPGGIVSRPARSGAAAPALKSFELGNQVLKNSFFGFIHRITLLEREIEKLHFYGVLQSSDVSCFHSKFCDLNCGLIQNWTFLENGKVEGLAKYRLSLLEFTE